MNRIEQYIAIMAKNTLDTQEAALYLGMTPEALRNKLPSVPHYKGENGRNYFRKEELDGYRCKYKVKCEIDLQMNAATLEAISRL